MPQNPRYQASDVERDDCNSLCKGTFPLHWVCLCEQTPHFPFENHMVLVVVYILQFVTKRRTIGGVLKCIP